MATEVSDKTATLKTLVSIIDDPDFDASNPDCVRDLIQYVSVQCRFVSKSEETYE